MSTWKAKFIGLMSIFLLLVGIHATSSDAYPNLPFAEAEHRYQVSFVLPNNTVWWYGQPQDVSTSGDDVVWGLTVANAPNSTASINCRVLSPFSERHTFQVLDWLSEAEHSSTLEIDPGTNVTVKVRLGTEMKDVDFGPNWNITLSSGSHPTANASGISQCWLIYRHVVDDTTGDPILAGLTILGLGYLAKRQFRKKKYHHGNAG